MGSGRRIFFVGILDILIPKRCVGCGKIGAYFCRNCRAAIKVIKSYEPICPVCEKPAIGGYTHPRCQTRYALDGLTSFFHYDGLIRKAVKSVKYRLVSDLTKEFILLIPNVEIPLQQGTVLIPIPLHLRRQHDRGFNQAEVLGKELIKRLPASEAGLRISMRTDILRRVRETVPQVAMKKREARLKNMEGIFGLDIQGLSHRRIEAVLLFDDVFTTGATMRSAANILKRAGVKFVWAVTMAR